MVPVWVADRNFQPWEGAVNAAIRKYGFCQCGCGKKTAIPAHTDTSKGWVKGVPLRYIKGHNLPELSKLNALNAIGNREFSSSGYVRVKTIVGRQYEHILVAESVLGRKLKRFGSQGHPDNEVVHHIDGNKANNATSNLIICTHSYHISLHHKLEASSSWPQFEKVVRRKSCVK